MGEHTAISWTDHTFSLCPEDCVDAKPSTMKGHRYIREFLAAHPEETPEERECRLHNEAMLKRNPSLFPEVSRG